jgi:prolipoprotein diacylglyceryltransferase
MTFPLDLHIGSLIIPVHPIFETLAFFIGYRYFLYIKRQRKNDPLSDDKQWWLVIGMALGAFIGSRLTAALEDPSIFLHSITWLYYVGGQTILGGVAGGIVGVEIAKKILGIRRKTGDLFVYPLILGMIIGRIGCLLTGVKDGTVGLPSNLPWAFDQGDGVPRHPTSLYEIIFLLISWLIIRRLEKKGGHKEGFLFAAFVFLYAGFRFFVEFIKPRETLLMGLSSIQLVAIALVVYYITYFIKTHDNS